MNRRSFFQLVTGLVAGTYTACVPKKAVASMSRAEKEKVLGIDVLREWHKSTPMEFVIKDERDLMDRSS